MSTAWAVVAIFCIVYQERVHAFRNYRPILLNTLTSLENELRNRRSSSIAEQIYSQDLLAPFFNRRQSRWLDNDLWKRSDVKSKSHACKERSKITYTSPSTATLDVRFPSVHTTRDDTYLCTGYKVPFESEESYIVKFVPHADMDQTHHMLVFGCPEITSKTYWNCYDPCLNKKTLYAWARNAPELTLPKDVGYRIGGESGIKYIVVQMHFAKAFKDSSCAGVTTEVTTQPQKYYAGIYLLGAYDINLPPHSSNVPATAACINSVAEPLHVFAFRTHAHMLANVITGYRVRDSQTKMIGKGNPKWPQSFYPRVGGEIVLKRNDVLAARCLYNNTRDSFVHAGPNGDDEMCNLYLMFYTSDKSALNRGLECWGLPRGVTESSLKLPPDVSQMAPYPGYAGSDSIEAVKEGKATVPPTPPEHMHHHHGGAEEEEKADEEMKEEFEEMKDEEEKEQEEQKGSLSKDELEKKMNELTKLVNSSASLSRSHGMPKYQGLQADLSYPQPQGAYHIGAVGGIVAAKDGSVYVFHRAGRAWTPSSFNSRNEFAEPNNPIDEDTVFHLDKDVGTVLHAWGKRQFFMPHGISLDPNGFIWLTDVAMHQVLKFPPEGATEPLMALGQRMIPGSDVSHFCKPTDVAVDTDGMIYVSDGYCNGRVMKFLSDGSFSKQWGRMVTSTDLLHPPVPPYAFFIAHNIILCGPEKEEVCVADRENGRIQCFTKNGSLTRIIDDKSRTGKRVFAITYSPLEGGVIYGVNGPDQSDTFPAGGFTVHYDTGIVMKRWEPAPDISLTDPHDITASPSGEHVYVGDLTNKKVFKFYQVPSALPTPNEKQIPQGVAFLSSPKNTEQIAKKDSESEIREDTDAPTVKEEARTEVFAPQLQPESKKEDETGEDEENQVKEFNEGNINTSQGATIIIVILVVLPTISILTAFICIRIRAKRLREYESLLSPNGKSSNGKSLNLGKFFNPTVRKGFSRVRSEASEDEEGSDVEVYSKKKEEDEAPAQ